GSGWVTLLSTDARYDLQFRTLIQPAMDVAYFNSGRFGGSRATLLANGKVLVTGTNNNGDVYDPATNTATLTGNRNVNSQRFNHTSTLLDDGTVLLAGGHDGNIARLATAETFNPATNTFTPTANNLSVARETASAVKLPNGKVLIAGGHDGS